MFIKLFVDWISRPKANESHNISPNYYYYYYYYYYYISIYKYKQHEIKKRLFPTLLVQKPNRLNNVPYFILLLNFKKNIFFPVAQQKTLLGPRPPRCWGFEITHRHTTLSRTSLEEGSARHSELYLTKHNIHNRKIPMSPAGFQLSTSASERPPTYALDRVATRIGMRLPQYIIKKVKNSLYGQIYLHHSHHHHMHHQRNKSRTMMKA